MLMYNVVLLFAIQILSSSNEECRIGKCMLIKSQSLKELWPRPLYHSLLS